MVLIGLGLLLSASLAISLGLQDILLRLAGDENRPLARHALDWSSALLAGAVDLVLAAALLAGVARLRIPLRRLLPSAVFIAVGLALLKTGGRWYAARMTRNPAYQVAAGAIGLLIFMYLLNQIILFAAALAATSTHGTVRDLAGGALVPVESECLGSVDDGSGEVGQVTVAGTGGLSSSANDLSMSSWRRSAMTPLACSMMTRLFRAVWSCSASVSRSLIARACRSPMVATSASA